MKYIRRLDVLLLAATLGCGDNDNGIVEPPPVLEAVVLGSIQTGAGVPIAGAAVEIQAWRDGCGTGVPIRPSGVDSASQLVTDAGGGYLGVLHGEGDSFDACLTVEVEAPPVYHVLPVADTGSIISFNPTEAPADSVRIDFVPTVDLPIGYRGISAGLARACGLTTRGAAFCWGLVDGGQIGGGLLPEPSEVPLAVAGGVEFDMLATSANHTCGMTGAGVAYCWGRNTVGELGTGAVLAGNLTPVAVAGSHVYEWITVGATFSCGVTTGRDGLCWGNNFVGQLGIGSDEILSPEPTPVAGGLLFSQIDGGGAFACGFTDSGAAHCWGVSWLGSLGDGSPIDLDAEIWSTVPVPVVGGLSFERISVGDYFACGLTADGRLYCWGDNRWGQVGDGTTESISTPTDAATSLTVAQVTTGGHHACVLTTDGEAYCWGRNQHGQLGDGTLAERHTPTPVATDLRFNDIAAGHSFTCAVTQSDEVHCWGRGTNGQLGNGILQDQLLPVLVADPY